jgi:hypothetical protein
MKLIASSAMSARGSKMKRVLLLLVSSILFTQLLVSQSQPTQSQNGTSSTTARSTSLTQSPNCADNGTYVNSRGQTVKRPASCASAPQGATAQCRDGTYSFSRSRRGTCSHHGGVAKWL